MSPRASRPRPPCGPSRAGNARRGDAARLSVGISRLSDCVAVRLLDTKTGRPVQFWLSGTGAETLGALLRSSAAADPEDGDDYRAHLTGGEGAADAKG